MVVVTQVSQTFLSSPFCHKKSTDMYKGTTWGEAKGAEAPQPSQN